MLAAALRGRLAIPPASKNRELAILANLSSAIRA